MQTKHIMGLLALAIALISCGPAYHPALKTKLAELELRKPGADQRA